jgi:hypothetical protein
VSRCFSYRAATADSFDGRCAPSELPHRALAGCCAYRRNLELWQSQVLPHRVGSTDFFMSPSAFGFKTIEGAFSCNDRAVTSHCARQSRRAAAEAPGGRRHGSNQPAPEWRRQ